MESIWQDDGLFLQRLSRSASAFAAVAKTLQRDSLSLNSRGEFLELYQFLSRCSSDIFTQIWSEPTAYAWIHRTYDLLRTTDRGAESLAELDRQLGQVKLYALSAAYLTETSLLFQEAYEPPQRFALPGTAWSFECDSNVKILGFQDGVLRLVTTQGEQAISLDANPSFETDSIFIFQCPIVKHLDCELRLQPHALYVPELEETHSTLLATDDHQREQIPLLRDALDRLATHAPQCFAQLQLWLKVISFRPVVDNVANASVNDLPGALLLRAHTDVGDLAESLVHEFHHYRLFLLEDEGEFFDSQESNRATEESYYSPWRVDPRPFKGLLHAAYVFTAVARFWLSVLRDPQTSENEVIRGRQRLGLLSLQLVDVMQTLREHADFSDHGRKLFDCLATDVDEVVDQIRANTDISTDVPALERNADGIWEPLVIDDQELSIRQVVEQHRKLFELPPRDPNERDQQSISAVN